MTFRRAARTDDNHSQIVKALRDAGAEVLSLAALGRGAPDILVSFRGVLALVECKDGAKSPSRQALTPMQANFHARWPVHLVNDVNGALDVLSAMRNRGA